MTSLKFPSLMFRRWAWNGMWLGVTGRNFVDLLAQAGSGTDGSDWVNYVLNGGPFAIVVLLIVMDRLTTPGERDRLRKELTAAHEREATINDNLRLDIVPALTRSIDALEANAAAAERFVLAADKLEQFMIDANRQIAELVNRPPAGGR